MKLVADSGSTKTTWALLDGQGPVSMYDSIGLNPRVVARDLLSQTLQEVARWVDARPVESVCFYGAGCGTEVACALMESLLLPCFPQAKVLVASDMLGACVATLGSNPGLVGILGTGSNACHYDGLRIDRQLPSLGYLLGDEGSGNHIGRMLLKSYYESSMPADLREKFAQVYNLDYSHVISNLYSQPRPNAYLASLSPFAREHRDNPFITNLLRNCFGQYFDHIVKPLGTGRISVVGSVAWYFQEELTEVAHTKEYTLDRVLRSPIEGIVKQL